MHIQYQVLFTDVNTMSNVSSPHNTLHEPSSHTNYL